MKFRSPAGLAGLALAVLLAAPAGATGPATVKVRVEGAQRTIFEGVVTTDARSITMAPGPDFSGPYPGGTHPCTGQNNANAGAYAGPGGTPTTALDDAARLGGFTWYGPFGSQDDFFIATIGGEGSINGPQYWDVRTNLVSNQRGGCQIELASGDEVLYAMDGYSKPALRLSGPTTAAPGVPFAVTVTDGDGAVQGAVVGGQTTNSAGVAMVTLGASGRLKADKAGSVRSGALDVCVTTGTDGGCGTTLPSPPDTVAPVVQISGVRGGQVFSRRGAPRELSGTVAADPAGLWAVKLRLTRRLGKTCWYFSGSRERFLERTCGKKYAFKVGDRQDWSYLLPARLPRGRYVLEAYAIDNLFNKSVPTRVAFRVR